MTETEPQDNEVRMSLGEHLEELRRRIIYSLLGVAAGGIVGLVFGRWIILMMEYPYKVALAKLGQPAEQLAVLSVGAGFDLYMKTAMYCGLLIGAPWIIYQIWAFVSVGLLPRERRAVRFAIPFFVALFLCGATFFVFLVAVPALEFLIGFDHWLEVKPVVTLQSQVGFMAEMMIVFGFAFQTPLVILVLAKVGLVSMRGLRKCRRHAIVAITAFAAVFAPGDVISMFALAVPMWLLYEGGVLLAWFLALRGREAEEESPADEAERELDDPPAGESS